MTAGLPDIVMFVAEITFKEAFTANFAIMTFVRNVSNNVLDTFNRLQQARTQLRLVIVAVYVKVACKGYPDVVHTCIAIFAGGTI